MVPGLQYLSLDFGNGIQLATIVVYVTHKLTPRILDRDNKDKRCLIFLSCSYCLEFPGT